MELPKHGKFSWNELATPDVEKAREFYSEVLGWSWREMDMGEGTSYTIWEVDGEDVGGAMQMSGPEWEGIPPHWMSYVAVDDVDARTAKVAEMGGTVNHGPMDIPGVGRFAVVTDPAGAVLSLMTFEAPAG